MEKAFIALILFVSLFFIGMFSLIGWGIYTAISDGNNCKSKGGIYHNSVCYEVKGILK